METLRFKRGDTWVRIFTWTDGEVPLDLSGASARQQIRDASGTLLAETSSAGGGITIDAPLGRVVSTFLPEQTAFINRGRYLSDLELTFADGTVQTTDTFSILVTNDETL